MYREVSLDRFGLEIYKSGALQRGCFHRELAEFKVPTCCNLDLDTHVMNLRKRLIAAVAKLGVEDRPLPGREDGFSSLCYGGKAFAHFHNDNELDIRLTKRIIEREGLAHPPNSAVHPKRNAKSHWIEVRFNSPEDLEVVIQLVKLTIANR